MKICLLENLAQKWQKTEKKMRHDADGAEACKPNHAMRLWFWVRQDYYELIKLNSVSRSSSA